MTKIAAISLLTIRTALHSRVFLSLTTAVIVCVTGFPLIVKSDGTLIGELKLILEYSLGSAFILLAAASLWAGSASVALEIAGKQIHLVRSKPVAAFQLWLGKWLGIVTLNAVLIFLAGALTLGMVFHSYSSARRAGRDTSEAEIKILASRESVLPDTPEQSFTVPFGGAKDFTFIVPANLSGTTENFTVEFSFIASRDPAQQVKVEWLIADNENSYESVFNDAIYGAGQHHFALPSDIFPENGVLKLRFKHLEGGSRQSLLFPETDSVKLLFNRGSFAGNFLKTILALLFKLGLLTAIGVTAGTLFSFPVATFVSFGGLAATGLTAFFTGQPTDPSFHTTCHGGHADAAGGLFHRFGLLMMAIFKNIFELFNKIDTQAMLASGTFISSDSLLWLFTVQILICCSLLCMLSGFVLSRKELAL